MHPPPFDYESHTRGLLDLCIGLAVNTTLEVYEGPGELPLLRRRTEARQEFVVSGMEIVSRLVLLGWVGLSWVWFDLVWFCLNRFGWFGLVSWFVIGMGVHFILLVPIYVQVVDILLVLEC